MYQPSRFSRGLLNSPPYSWRTHFRDAVALNWILRKCGLLFTIYVTPAVSRSLLRKLMHKCSIQVICSLFRCVHMAGLWRSDGITFCVSSFWFCAGINILALGEYWKLLTFDACIFCSNVSLLLCLGSILDFIALVLDSKPHVEKT